MHSFKRFGDDHYEKVRSLMSAFMTNSLKDNQYRYFNILSKYPVIFITLPEIEIISEGKSELLQRIGSLYTDHSYLRNSYYD